MTKISGNRPVAGGYGVSPAQRAASVQGAVAPQPVHRAIDSSAIQGIPEAELTPNVKSALMGLMEEVDTLRRELDIARARIEDLVAQADQDVLLPEILNRRAFVREMSRLLSFAERYDIEASVVYFDMNDFKQINDEHGHTAGDDALRKVGEVLLKNVRTSDIVGRLGGDEFAVVLAKAGETEALQKASGLAQAINSTVFKTRDGAQVKLSTSFGAYTFQKGEDIATAIEHADRAMFDAKRNKPKED